MKAVLARRQFLSLTAGAVATALVKNRNTVWVNRMNATAEELKVAPDLICNDLKGLVDFVDSRK